MKVILYIATTINGMIAKTDDGTDWISKEEWNTYSKMAQEVGCLIIGRRTYQILTKQPEFTELKDVKIVVVSKSEFELLAPNHFVLKTPKEAIEACRGAEKVILAGGGALNSSFMEENLVNEIYLDIEPVAFSKGVSVFSGGNFESKLKLLEVNKITENEIQLHYEVI